MFRCFLLLHINLPSGAGGYTPSNGVTVATVQATDADTGIFGQVSYSITAVSNSKNANDNAISKFRISGSLGVVECIGSVSGDEQYTITVRAADGGTGLDQRFATTVSEGIPTGSSVFASPASDPERDTLQYSMQDITNNNIVISDFVMNTSTGLLTTRNFARETSTSRSATATLSISITDINDNNPQFLNNQLFTFSVQEGQNSQVAVGTVTAVDNDAPGTPNSAISYSIQPLPPNTFQNQFSINSNTGAITTVQPLDYETQRVHYFLVLARDNAVDSRTGTATGNRQCPGCTGQRTHLHRD
uniref:Cadherin domain-containing protein n=1 Tax=Magallana gigas TaxID=29159 RepID=A0A8W8LT35_MAGGI